MTSSFNSQERDDCVRSASDETPQRGSSPGPSDAMTDGSVIPQASEDGDTLTPRHNLAQQLETRVSTLAEASLVVLHLVCHNDDEIIGGGATLATLTQMPGVALFLVVIAADNPQRRRESLHAAKVLNLPPDHLFQFDFPDGDLITHQAEVQDVLQAFQQALQPDLVVTHKIDDHLDHTVLASLTKKVFGRGGTSLLHFRIPQPTSSPWQPTVFVRVSEAEACLKLGDLMAAFPTENWKDFFDPETHAGILREAGVCAGVRYAEPFEATQVTLSPCPCGCGALGLGVNPGRNASSHSDLGPSGPQISRLVLEPSACGRDNLHLARHAARRTSIADGHSGSPDRVNGER